MGPDSSLPNSPAEVETLAGGPEASEAAEADNRAELLERGAQLGRYLVLRTIGVGGMGVVYAAFDPRLDRQVAVKLVHPLRATDDIRLRLLREAKAMAKLTHPNVVTVHDVGTVDEQIFVAMEFIEGQSLREWLAQGPRTRTEVLDVMRQAGRGLEAAHEAGLIHRDFKPDNVMISSSGRVVVMDFGLVRAPELSEVQIKDSVMRNVELPADFALKLDQTEAGSMLGTPGYMAPEQFLGGAADARTDQFSFCVTLYEALYREKPFPGQTVGEVMMSVTRGKVADEPRAANVPRWLRRVLMRGLAAQPRRRWDSMSDVLVALAGDPARRKKLLFGVGGIGGAAVFGALALVGVSRVDRSRQLEACDEAAEGMNEVWNPNAAAALSGALRSTGALSADESFERVSPRLDEWTGRWKEQRRATCERAMVDEALELELYSRMSACFDEQRERLAATLEVYGDPEVGTVSGVVRSVAGLTRLETCADERAVAQRPVLPDPEGAVASARRRLARASALADSARFDQGLQIAREAVAEAETLGWPPLEAEARMLAASIRSELGNYVEVGHELDLAFSGASAAGDDALAARAAIQLLRLRGYHLARTDEGLAWSRVAAALLERLERTEGLDAAAWASNTGLAYESRGDWSEAEKWHARALELRHALLGEDHPEAAHSYGNLGNVCAARHDYEEAAKWHQRALDVRVLALGPNHPDTARSHNNLGKVYLALARVDTATQQFERALEILEPTIGASHRVTARVLYNLGDCERANGRAESALEYYRRALAIQEPLLGQTHPEASRSAHRIGAVLAPSDPGAALQHLRRALRARETRLGTDHPETKETLEAIADLCGTGYSAAC